PADAAAFLARLSDVRTDLALPVVAVPPRPRGAQTRTRATSNGGETTQVVRGGGTDTSVVPRDRQAATAPPPRRSAPPPPIVTPPPRRLVSPRMRRRRRNLIVLLVVLLLAVGAGYGGWWFASGRYGRVPNVTGQAQSDAIQHLRDAGYQVSSSVTRAFSENVPSGDVISTDPSVGSRVTKGRTISLTVSKGQERFTLPSVAGTTVDAARAQLTAKVPEVVLETGQTSSETVPKGKVAGTDPKAGTKVKRGQTITILVSTGPPIVQIPAIAPGTPLADAQQQLQAKGFKTTVVQNFDDTIAKGTVISLDPNDEAPKGSTITINVSQGPSEVQIPDIAQLTPVDQARKALEELGLKVKIEKAFGGKSGLVVGVSPGSGTTVPVGTTETLTII
ncbi:MAG: PASTA domain-containing protein, partial [Pseudolysinimonas sp.]